ncbi:hypothetical protein ONZ45_g19266 [Pleurotus djamor]|nr:hypothetical protein ONZ45_g19266 [Pleurotus djamor]
MKLQAFTAFVTFAAATNAHNIQARHNNVVHKRQTTTLPGAAPTPAPGIPPLESISSGMPTGTTLPVSGTFTAGATPPVSGAPVLPTPFVFSPAEWPAQDSIPAVDSPEVKEWLLPW